MSPGHQLPGPFLPLGRYNRLHWAIKKMRAGVDRGRAARSRRAPQNRLSRLISWLPATMIVGNNYLLPARMTACMPCPMDAVRAETDSLAEVRHRAPTLDAAHVNYGLLTELTGFSIKLAWILGYALLTRAFGASAVTPHRFSMLEMIGRNPGFQPMQLASALALSRPATTLAIDFWEARGCVERRKIAGDRRSSGVFMTTRGQKELERLRARVRRADAALTASLSDDELKELRGLLAKIHR
jgi:DNA-binding MarR family transcriptional regulator